MSVLPWADLAATLEIAVLRRLRPYVFETLTAPPAWLVALWPDAGGRRKRLRPAQAFPFLEPFLDEAETFWSAGTKDRIRSGFWYEVDEKGEEYQLEATALTVEGDRLLVLEFPRTAYRERQEILQKSREIGLAHDQTLKEIQKKEILLHYIVHDLRNPLEVMKGVLDLLAAQPLDAAQEKALLASGQHQAVRQEAMIQNILAAFSAEMQAFESFAIDPAEAPDMMRCARNAMAQYAAAAPGDVHIRLDPAIDPATDWRAIGEASRMERVLANLLDSAARYSPPGSTITIGLSREDHAVLTTIEGQGAGMPEELVETLFDKFVQEPERFGAGGLGLYFCRMTIERWGGTIGCHNRPEGGVRFWFRLPRPDEAYEAETGDEQ